MSKSIVASTAVQGTFSKTAIVNLKNKSITEKDELQRLNSQLKNYLEDVRRLEDLNMRLLEEVDRAKLNSLPKVVDKTDLDKELDLARYKLEEESNLTVHYQLKLDDNQRLCEHIASRIKFFQQEGEMQKQKIIQLQNYLEDVTSEKEFLVHGAKLALEDIEREKGKQESSEKEIENLRISLNETKARNKNLEFQTHTLLDEVEFRKAIFLEESNYLRTRFNGTILNSTELTGFYKNELAIAIRQIRQDFVSLNEQQMREYKELKEQELAFASKIADEDRAIAEQTRARLSQNSDLERQNAQELNALSISLKDEYLILQAEYEELLKRLEMYQDQYKELKDVNAAVVDKLTAEIAELKEQNQGYTNELEYWDRVTRTKLESEITTYRSLLNSQLKVVQNATPPPPASTAPAAPVSTPASPATKPKSGKVVVTTIVTEQIVDDDGNVIDSKQRTVSNQEN